MSEYVPVLLTQAMYYIPSLLAHMVVLALAAWTFGRNRGAAVALGTGTVLQLLASLASFGTTAMFLAASQQGWALSELSMISSAISLGASLLRALGEVVVAGGVYLGVKGAAPPADPVDPYGYGRR